MIQGKAKASQIGPWLLPILLLGGLILVALLADRWPAKGKSGTAFAQSVPGRLQPFAKHITARACGLLAWIDHLQNKRGQPLPATLILSDGAAPWEPIPLLAENLAQIEQQLGDFEQADIKIAQFRVSWMRSANKALQSSVADLLTAQVAADLGRAETARSKFESARDQARRAASRAEEAAEPLPTTAILDGGGAVLMSAQDPCAVL